MLILIPSCMTGFRIVLAVWILYTEMPFWIVLLAGVSDFLDGFLARCFGVCSDFGRVFDPIADKLFSCAMLWRLYVSGLMSSYVFVGFLIRDVLLIVGFLMFCDKVKVQPTIVGKCAMMMLFLGGLLLFYNGCEWLMYVSLVCAYYALAEYGWILFDC